MSESESATRLTAGGSDLQNRKKRVNTRAEKALQII